MLCVPFPFFFRKKEEENRNSSDLTDRIDQTMYLSIYGTMLDGYKPSTEERCDLCCDDYL